MKILFLGVGEACDSRYGNSSALITTKNSAILLDCGFSVPHKFFGYCDDPDCLDFVWISHFHGDHFFGLPLLLLRFWEMGRTRPLQFIGQEELAEKTAAVLELAYAGFSKKLSFPLEFHTITPGSPLLIDGLQLQAGKSAHTQCNYGLLVDDGSHRLYYSGDGRPTAENRRLIHGCDLALHEAFTLNNSVPGHGSINGCLQLMEEENIKQLALLHIERSTRQAEKATIKQLIKQHPGLLLPKDGDSIILN
jgi:ribonuclease BN (tRNA processing enzyme)